LIITMWTNGLYLLKRHTSPLINIRIHLNSVGILLSNVLILLLIIWVYLLHLSIIWKIIRIIKGSFNDWLCRNILRLEISVIFLILSKNIVFIRILYIILLLCHVSSFMWIIKE